MGNGCVVPCRAGTTGNWGDVHLHHSVMNQPVFNNICPSKYYIMMRPHMHIWGPAHKSPNDNKQQNSTTCARAPARTLVQTGGVDQLQTVVQRVWNSSSQLFGWVRRPTGGSSSQVNQERPLTPLASPLERVERQVRSTECGAQPLSCYPQNGKIARLPEFSERVLDKPVEKPLGSQ